MAAEPDLLARDGARSPRAAIALVLLIGVVALIVLVVAHQLTGGGGGVTVQLRVQGPDAAAPRLLTVRGAPAARLSRDVTALVAGRVDCGAPGPPGVVITVGPTSYDVNEECSRVVRLPEHAGEQVWLESAALSADLSAAIGASSTT